MLRVIENGSSLRQQWIVVRDEADGRPSMIAGPYDRLRTAMHTLNRLAATRELAKVRPQRRRPTS